MKTSPKWTVLHNLDFEEVEVFLNSLTGVERKYISNILESPITVDFITGVRIDNKLVGIAGFVRYFRFFHFSFHIVKSEFQGRGISKQLTTGLVSYAKEKGDSFFLASTHWDKSSLAIWLKQGYKIVYEGGDLYYRLVFPLNWRGEVVCKLLPIICNICFPIIRKLKRVIFR